MAEAFRLGVQAGDGLVARVGAAVLVADDAGVSDTFTRVVLDILDTAGADTSDDALVWRVAEQVLAAQPDVPAFGLVLGVRDGYQLLLHGEVRAMVDDDQRFLGQSARTWLDQVVPGNPSTIAVTLTPAGDVTADPRSDLRGGRVSGTGFVLHPMTARAGPADRWAQGPPEPARDVADTGRFERPLAKDARKQVSAEAVPRPPAGPPSLVVSENVGGAAGRPAAETIALTEALTALVSEDGVRAILDRSYVFGREPQRDGRVTNGSASPIRLDDPDQLISRVQAYVDVTGTGVLISDVGSANGTFMAAPGAADWVRIGDEAAELPVGWSIRMGRRVLTHVQLAPGP